MRGRLFPWRLTLYLAVAITLYGPAYAHAASAGLVSALSGQVQIQRAGHPVVVAYGTPVEIGDRISTGAHSQATITLSDGTQFELTEFSNVTLTDNRVNASGQRIATRLDMLSGLVHSLVRFAPGNAPNYEVHTPNAVAAARGTDYDTDYVKGVVRKENPGCLEFTDITVFDGVVDVSNPKNPTAGSTRLARGFKTTVPCALLLGATVATTAALSTGAFSTGAVAAGAAVGAGAIAAGVVAGVVVSGGSSASAPTASPTPVITPAS